MSNFIKINGIKIGEKFPPYVVAEMSANHNGDIKNAFKIIEYAKKCGASAIKIQTYKPDTITINSDKKDFIIKEGLWKGKTLYDLYKWAHTPWEWQKEIFDFAKNQNITLFSSPFDKSAVDFLEDLNCPAYKIASFELIDLPLIKYVAATKKPVIMSTGMANFEEIKEAVTACKDSGCNEIALLHCVSAYPASPSEYNLKTIEDIKSKFNLVVGLSDHTIDNTTAICSISQGASIIEKHFTLDRGGGGPDDSFSVEPKEFMELCKSSKIAWNAVGKVNYEKTKSEKENLIFRRSLYFVKDIEKDQIITKEHIKSIRPGYGIKPKYYEKVIGLKASRKISRGTPVKKEYLIDFKKNIIE
jgi:pseudaminic acid synthase